MKFSNGINAPPVLKYSYGTDRFLAGKKSGREKPLGKTQGWI
jgi:hypothetical protein